MVNIGIIGAGYWGPNLIRNFSSLENCRVKYVADLRDGRLEFVKQNYPEIKTTNDYNIILEDKDILVVVIATPVTTHFKLGVEAFNANKHLYIEKPFTATAEEAQKLVRLAREKGKILMVGHLFEYHPAVNKVKEILDSGKIGEIFYIDAARINMGPPESEVNVIWDLAPHDLSIILYLLGETPITVRCIGSNFRKDQWNDLIQASYITLGFKNNKFAQIHNSWLSPNKTRRMEIFGSKGVILYDEMRENKITIFDEGIDLRKSGGAKTSINLTYGIGKIEYPEIHAGEPLKIECEHFINCIETGKSPRSDGIDGMNVVKIIEKANLSITNNGATLEF